MIHKKAFNLIDKYQFDFDIAGLHLAGMFEIYVTEHFEYTCKAEKHALRRSQVGLNVIESARGFKN